MTAEFSLPIRVYIEDTDAGGIVYYVNYLKYLERARTELMRTFGLERAAVSDAGWNFVVSDVARQLHSVRSYDVMMQCWYRGRSRSPA